MNWHRQTAVTFLLVIFAFSFFENANAQVARGRSTLPKQNYYQSFGRYYSGDFARSGRDFQQAYRTAFQFGETRFLDSACALTMIGECHYQVGNYADALVSYEQALKLYLSYNRTNWQSTVQVPQTLPVDTAAFQRSRVNWGTPTRNTSIPRMPSSFQMMFGRLDAARAYVEGGVYDRANLRSVDVTEVMRCMSLALHRRRQLLGPLNKIDPMSRELLTGLTVRGAGDGSILGAYNGVLLGIALASMERYTDAARMLTNSLQIDRRFDHALTPVALIELTRMAMSAGQKVEAATLALEASYSAGVFRQYDLVDEALSLGTTNHLSSVKTPYPPLANAIQWCDRDNVRLPQLSLIQRLAECHAEAGNSGAALTAVGLAGTADRRRNTLPATVANARLKYTTAMISFTEGNFAAGLADLSAALSQYQNGSLWLFRLRLVSDSIANGRVSELEADKLYSALLHDPTEADWKLNPIEPLSFLTTDHVTAMETWFDILVRRRQFDRALQVAELIRRHRFYSTLPMGGRLLAFRHALNSEKDKLDPQTAKQRDNFLGRNSAYQELLAGALTIQKELIKLPLVPKPDSDEERKKRQLLAQLSQVSSIQEAMMASYALSREPSNLAYPPQMTLDGFQRLIPRGTLCLSTLKTSSGYHMFFVSKERIRYVNLGSAQGLDRAVTKLLRDIGAIGGSSTDPETLQLDEWRETASELKRGLFAEIPDQSFANIVELVIIPDGMLWYMPFEALPLDIDGQEKFLVDLCPIRYSPTMYLSVEFPGGGQLQRNSVAVGSMHSRGEIETTQAEVEELKKKFPDLESYEKQTTPSGLSSWLTDHLMVWSQSFLPQNGFDFQPVPFDVSDHSTVRSWMALPWYGPEYLSMPGLRTFSKGRKANGSEMFVTSVALMSSGSRTIMLPRWPTGGAVSLGLSRLYSEHLSEKKNGPKALRQAMIDARDLDVDLEKEPQIKKVKEPGDVSAAHPFFWASFFVVDQPRLKVEEVVPGNMPLGGKTNPPVVMTPTPKVATPQPPGGTSTTAGAAANPKDKSADSESTEKPETDKSVAGEKKEEVEKPAPDKEKKPAPKRNGGIF